MTIDSLLTVVIFADSVPPVDIVSAFSSVIVAPKIPRLLCTAQIPFERSSLDG